MQEGRGREREKERMVLRCSTTATLSGAFKSRIIASHVHSCTRELLARLELSKTRVCKRGCKLIGQVLVWRVPSRRLEVISAVDQQVCPSSTPCCILYPGIISIHLFIHDAWQGNFNHIFNNVVRLHDGFTASFAFF